MYFENIHTLHQYTLALELHQDAIQCDQCHASDQFVSHGFVYRYLHYGVKEAVGKRILCSDRYGKSGCGKTFRLYLAKMIPALRHTTHHLHMFIASLLTGLTIQQAYQGATNTEDPRNAYRWLHKLTKQMVNYRGFLKTRHTAQSFFSRSPRLQLLLPTLQQLFTCIGKQACTHYQLLKQRSLIG